jgi:hypothetical protein
MLPSLDLLWSVLNANFTIAFVGGFTGAIGGALGAQYIAERMKRREELLRELRSTNASIMTCFSICNAALMLKHQHVKPMHDEFEKQKVELNNFKKKFFLNGTPITQEYRFTADMRTFPALVVPLDTLKTLVFERISVYGRPLALVSVLEQSLVGLKRAIDHRDCLIQRFQSGTTPKELLAHHYFGLQQSNGDTNQEYPDTVVAIFSYVDDVAYFSSLLCSDLVKHGEQVRAMLAKSSDKSVPHVSKADFSGPKSKGLLPSEENYTDWLQGFQTQESGNEKD